jgi:hypothetical protein
MSNRPRIKKELLGNIVVDEVAYTQNKSLVNAKKVLDKSHHIEIEIWCAQHYYSRAQLGDENGKRAGIDEESIKEVVVNSIQHLFYNSFKLKTFTFINFEHGTRKIKIVLQVYKKEGILNVVTEFHHLEKNKYEVTVITAMQEDGFSIGVGQFALEIDGDSSVLRKFDGKNLIDVDIYKRL